MSSSPPLVRVAQYVRMSTDHQRYSTENQSAAIFEYAARRGMEVVRDYIDSGKSGLNIEGREGLRALLHDVQRGSPGFEAVLVYDISRWGRFQDADESAYYEHICKRAGIRVIYVAENFENDGSPMATIFKSVKRTMAGEYSRELSNKVFIGHCRLLGLGFHQGGSPGFGLRRRLIGERGEIKGELGRGEHKNLQTDRVVLIPGPPEETETILEIFSGFVREHLKEAQIAQRLNAREAPSPAARPWNASGVRRVLLNERLIGLNIYNRTSSRLKSKRKRNTPDLWLRSETGVDGIVPREMWDAVQAIFLKRAEAFDNATMLALLKALQVREGRLSGVLIDEQLDMPPATVYARRFGGLLRAYQLIGFSPTTDHRYVEENRALRAKFPGILADVTNGLSARGATVSVDERTDLITVDSQWTVSVSFSRCAIIGDRAKWRLRLDTSLSPSVSVCIRMQPGGTQVRDYYIFPRACQPAIKRLGEFNPFAIDAFRFDSLEPLYILAQRITWREAA